MKVDSSALRETTKISTGRVSESRLHSFEFARCASESAASVCVKPGDHITILGHTCGADGKFNMDLVIASLPQARLSFQDELTEEMSKNGIAAEPQFSVEIGPNGHVLVSPVHGQRSEEITSMFERNRPLYRKFNEISSAEGSARAFSEAYKFQMDYAKDPITAVAKHSSLLSSSGNRQLQLTVHQQSMAWGWSDGGAVV